MMKTMLVAALAGAAAILSFQSAQAQTADATADMMDRDGNAIGTVELRDAPHGALLHAQLSGLPEGTHAFHIHEVGECEPPFESAGDHYNPTDSDHGFLVEEGPHAGDMPNIHVPQTGELEFEVLNTFVMVQQLLDEPDGTSLIIHEGEDDYESQPSGDAGDRLACGVIEGQ